MRHKIPDDLKQDKALKLSEQGLTPQQIAERIGSTSRGVCTMLRKARERREKVTEGAAE